MVRSSALRYSASLPDFASASSARLRNRAEEALAKSGSEAEYRSALERTIEESDGLIRTFNALLMIARAESGQARGNMDDFDAADVANGIHELYEPLAEDDGMTLRVQTAPTPLHGNRELISQALANLVENAIKYGKPAPSVLPLSAEGRESLNITSIQDPVEQGSKG